jgi:hypothetical protein
MKHWFLRPACLPIPSPGQFILILIYKIKKMVGREGFGSLAGRPSFSNALIYRI